MEFNFEPTDNRKNLEKYARDLNYEVSHNKLTPIIGRENEIRRIIEIISRKDKNNPVLIGEPGVGKTAIVEGLVQKIISNDVPIDLKDAHVYEISLSSLLAGASYQGEFEKRLNKLIEESKSANYPIILFIDEIHQISGLGKNGPNSGMDAANILKPLMARGEIKIIGATTLNEYRQYIEKDGALERRMQKIIVEEPSAEETLAIMRGLKEKWEIFHKVRINDNALVAAVKLSNRYIADKFFPDKAIDLIDEAAAKIKTEAFTLPIELEETNRNIFLLEAERVALKKENLDINKDRISNIDKELITLKENQSTYSNEWNRQKKQQSELNKIKKDIEQSNFDIEKFQSMGNYEEASKILYSQLPKLKNDLEKIEKEISINENILVKDYVNEIDVAEVVSRITKIPLSKIHQKEQEKLLSLKSNLSKRIKGQDNAIELVSNVILRNRIGINNPLKPIGSFLFLGPTGVGKTELAKALAENLFDNEKSMIRLNMSEYMEKHSLSKLIGAPPGYIGYEQAGELSEQVRRKPYSIILLDEIEKTHPDILNILLQILDDGELRDSQGRKINFKNTIIIMTSNIAQKEILEGKNDEINNQIKKAFKAEFINRIDEIIKFNPIDLPIAKQISEKLLFLLSLRIKENHFNVTFTKSVVDYVAKNGFDLEYGARPISRFIQKNIEMFLTTNILENKITVGSACVIDYNNESGLIIKKPS
ncbi:MAG: AAA family ATPase [Malacoplasma sp.]